MSSEILLLYILHVLLLKKNTIFPIFTLSKVWSQKISKPTLRRVIGNSKGEVGGGGGQTQNSLWEEYN